MKTPLLVTGMKAKRASSGMIGLMSSDLDIWATMMGMKPRRTDNEEHAAEGASAGGGKREALMPTRVEASGLLAPAPTGSCLLYTSDAADE